MLTDPLIKYVTEESQRHQHLTNNGRLLLQTITKGEISLLYENGYP